LKDYPNVTMLIKTIDFSYQFKNSFSDSGT